jgi:endonuclease-3 related protein
VSERKTLLRLHEALLARLDIDRWHWDGHTSSTDVCLGAILVQHTSWDNVEKALARLREAGAASFDVLGGLEDEALENLVRPSGTPRVKARRLKAFAALLAAHGGFDGLFALETVELRRVLLATYGVGPETADVVLLYAARRPVVVHDAYTARLCRRVGIGPERDGYDAWAAWLDEQLPSDLEMRWRNHAAIVLHCKETCRSRPKCGECPLQGICAYGQGRES